MTHKFVVTLPEDFGKEFFQLVDKVNLSLTEDNDNFFGYFLFQLSRDISFTISSPTAVTFKGANYVIYFNPLIYLNLNLKQMEATIKHEILHILSMHLLRARELRGKHSTLAINMAMDIVVNSYLNYPPPYATTLEATNAKYGLQLVPYASFEYYVKRLQAALDLMEEEDTSENNDINNENIIETEYDAARTHDLWDSSDDVDASTLSEFTEKIIHLSQKGELPDYVENMIASLHNCKGELPWNLYLNRLMGSVESNKKKTVTRRDRRQPDRLDLRGQLRSHKANIVVAVDISGSISDEEFKQAMVEVLTIVKNYKHEVTIIECDDVIRREYTVKSIRDLKDRIHTRGSTKFNPVFEYANHKNVNLLVYFTDGKGEERLNSIPRGYHILWVISGKEDTLSLKEPYGAVKKLRSINITDNILDITDVTSGGYSMNYQERNL